MYRFRKCNEYVRFPGSHWPIAIYGLNVTCRVWPRLLDFVNGDMNKIYPCFFEVVSWNVRSTKKCEKKIMDTLPKKFVSVRHCDWNGFSESKYCKFSETNECVKTKYPNIIQHPDLTDHSNKCPPNETLKCNPIECSCDKNEWKKSGKCCDGKEFFHRDVSHKPECHPTKEEINAKCLTPCSAREPPGPPPVRPTKAPTPSRRIVPSPGAHTVQSKSSLKSKHPDVPRSIEQLMTTAKSGEPTAIATPKKNPGPGGKKDESDRSNLNMIIGIVSAVAAVILLLLVIVLVVLCQRRKKTNVQLAIIRDRKSRRHYRNKGSEPRKGTSKSKPSAHGKVQKDVHRGTAKRSGIADTKDGKKGHERRKGLDVQQKQKEKGIKASVVDETGKHHTGKHSKPTHKRK